VNSSKSDDQVVNVTPPHALEALMLILSTIMFYLATDASGWVSAAWTAGAVATAAVGLKVA
jgi:steroid 5-alpha reductase family enzyme